MIEAVIFDMDGVVLDSERIAKSAWQRAARDFGLEISDELYLKVTGRHTDEARRIFEAALGPAFSYETTRERRSAYFNGELERGGLPLRPGLDAALAYLENRKISRAIATSTRRAEALRRLDIAGIGGRFPLLVGGDEVTRSKPAPDIFLRAAELLRKPPAACLVVEDSLAGIAAAEAAGMPRVFVPDLTPASAALDGRVIAVLATLADIPGLIENLRSRAQS
jgi:HAD superfamily hydrolase (TIGR01509 family)